MMTATLLSPSSSRLSPARCEPRWATPRTPGRLTYGPKARAVGRALGFELDDWQQRVLDVALEVDPATGRLAFREVWVLVPRQQGKSTLLLAAMVWRALGLGGPQRILYTAQTRSDARKKWEDDWLPVLDRSPLARAHHARKTNGHEASIFTGGSHLGLVASTEKAGHGQVLDMGVLDEAFAQVDARVEQAMVPAMNTRPSPQFWGVSTAGTADSLYLRSKVEMGRGAVDRGVSGVAYFEWSAADDEDPADPRTWAGCMPTLGGRTGEDVVAAALESMPLSEFRRAFLNQWTEQKSEPVIPLAAWRECRSPRSRLSGPVTFGVDVTPDRSRASIVAVGAGSSGRCHVEVVDNRAGTGWCVDRVVELCGRHDTAGVVVDAAGPAGSLVSRLEAELPPGVRLRVSGPREMGRWCGAFYDAAVEKRLAHLGCQELEAAVVSAKRRRLGDAWAWARAGAVDISPLVAGTVALGAHLEAESAPARGAFMVWA